MNKIFKISIVLLLFGQNLANGQAILNVYPDSLITPVNVNLTPGVFYVPKTQAAANDFIGNNIQQNAIRTNVIESVLNNTSNLTSCLALLSTVQTNLQVISRKCDKLIFIFEKMPAWLSSSTNGSPASTPGWYVLNTKPPANWNTWQTVVDSITAKIVNQFGISNAYFEIWNEPDLGSWTGTMNDYFTLYKRTYDGIKSANSKAKAGGPAVNFWANNIYWQPPYGHLSKTKADSSLIGQLLDSAIVWKKAPDFISWHNFNISHQEFANATNYIQKKLASLSLPNTPLIVSEWNAPSQIRDTRLASSYLIKAQLELSKTLISNNMIAAWQDFNPATNEFHNDYGLLTYGTIHKPAYNSILLSEKLNGITCKMNSTALYDGVSAVIKDTLFILISNYCPPPFVEAFNNTLYQGQFNANQLDSAGYVNIGSNSISHLDSIYKGLIVIPKTNALQIAINNSIGIYKHYASIATSSRQFNLSIGGYKGNYSGQLFIIDSTQNNMQFKYDSLQKAGFTQPSAIAAILPNQNIKHSTISLNAGQFLFSLQPNAVCLFKITIPKTTSISENNFITTPFVIYPNPTSDKLTIVFSSLQLNNDVIQIYNSIGVLVKTVVANQAAMVIDVSELTSGIYFVQLKNYPKQKQKFIKQR
jgi:Glycosyl hydrolases family 39/Secretion system C-terminal sorting domain